MHCYCIAHAAGARRPIMLVRMRKRSYDTNFDVIWIRKMVSLLIVFVAVAASVLRPSAGQAECPCKNHTLCQPLSTKPYKEVLAFVVNQVSELAKLMLILLV